MKKRLRKSQSDKIVVDWEDPSYAPALRAALQSGKLIIGVRKKKTAVGKLIFSYPGKTDAEKIYNFTWGKKKIPICEVCLTAQAHFTARLKRYQPWCSSKCSASHSKVLEKKKSTILKKYGVESIFHSTQVQAKINETKLEKFGGHQMLSEDVVLRRANTLNARYGGIGLAAPEINQKIASTMISRYGYEHNWQSPNLVKKYIHTRQANFLNYRLEYFKSCGVTPLFDFDEYQGYDKDTAWKCNSCNNSFIGKMTHGVPKCPACNPHGSSVPEKEIAGFIENELNLKVERRIRPFEDSRSIDIYVPTKKLAIEYNGLCFHSELSLWADKPGKDKHYHVNKTRDCAKLGIELFHIFEDDWMKNPELIKSMIKAKLGVIDRKIFARNTMIAEIPSATSREFLTENHIQGSVPAKIHVGIFHHEELIGALTCGKPRYSKEPDMELLRYCTKRNLMIVGGFSKLLKYIESRYKPKSIISYCDLSRSVGNVYLRNGFSLVRKSPPSYWYWSNEEPWKHHRSSFMKHKLKNKISVFDSKLSEVENMFANKWNRIWDCGTAVFIKSLEVR